MISFAQNGEDVRLRRAFPSPSGFYVDVGAFDPVSCSITKHFYDRGWHGLNLEPSPTSFARVVAGRPRDMNVNVGVSNRDSKLSYFEFPPEFAGLSTLSRETAEKHALSGFRFVERTVEVVRLATLLQEHAPRVIDFMVIDVEGHEREVIEGAELRRFRPRVLVVEATLPRTKIASHAAWEPLIVDAGYRFATFDGLNRFYVREEDLDLIPLLEVPPNSLDEYVPHVYQAELDALRGQVRQLRNESLPVKAARALDRGVSRFRKLSTTLMNRGRLK